MSGLLERFRAGDRHALARILTHVENETDVGAEALRALSPSAGNAHVIGVTGPPGAGKSTLANELVKEVRRQGRRIAVLAIDPTSPLTGGAMLGDRIRMLESQGDDGVYVRSMASRGQIGGLTIAAFGGALVLDAFGFDVVLIETVGAGQDEVDIARLADSVVIVQTPGMGDSIQAVKAGILEIGDILVVNKADQPGADETVRDLREQVRTGATPDWRVPVLPVVASSGTGVSCLLQELDKHREFAVGRGILREKRDSRLHHHAKMLAVREFTRYLNGRFESSGEASNPTERANEMLARFREAQDAPGNS